MTLAPMTLRLSSEDDTARLGQTLAKFATGGDCILLRGQIGAGKSALARAFIRARLGPDTEVPSPTFTLVQTYEHDDVEIWHADLYRLTDAQEAVELGLTDAFEDQICLIEWPELLGDMVPETALHIELTVAPDFHVATLTYGENWHGRLTEGLKGA
ncbi:MAG: tRNA (adenosine(37)-N6)-threonylcarbamoyltransferase complex ATPase subunit type 1 TsaE [Octadecabacter sp.]